MVKQPLTDQQLVLRSRGGDDKAFRELFSRYQRKLGSYLRHLGASSDEAEDLLQDIFLKAFTALRSFDARRKFSPWIYRISHNEAVNYFKRMNRRRTVSLDDIVRSKDELDIAELSGTPEEVWILSEQAEVIRKALSDLSQDHRSVIVLRYYHDKSYAEMSEILGKPENTVASMLNRAKKKLILSVKQSGAMNGE